MNHGLALSLCLALVACNSNRGSDRRAAPRPAPSVAAVARDVPPSTAEVVDAGPPVPLRVFALDGGRCDRTPPRGGFVLGPNAHPAFTRDILEVELRGLSHACTRPVFEPSFDGDTLVLRTPLRRDANGCTCRHDMMLQITGVPRSTRAVRFERDRAGADAGVEVLLTRDVDTAAPAAPAADASTTGA